jgi:hypothetical protein
MAPIPGKLVQSQEHGITMLATLFLVLGDMMMDLLRELGQLLKMNQLLSSIQLQ